MFCQLCSNENLYYGRLVWPQEPGGAWCPNHKDEDGQPIEVPLILVVR